MHPEQTESDLNLCDAFKKADKFIGWGYDS